MLFFPPNTSVLLRKNVCLSIHPFIHPSTHPFVHPSDQPFDHPSIHLPIHPPIHSPFYPPIHPSVRLSIHPSIHPSTHSFIHSFIPPTNFLSSYSVSGTVLGSEETVRNQIDKNLCPHGANSLLSKRLNMSHQCMNKEISQSVRCPSEN